MVAGKGSLAAVRDQVVGEVAGVGKGPGTVGTFDGLPLSPSLRLVVICGGTSVHMHCITFSS